MRLLFSFGLAWVTNLATGRAAPHPGPDDNPDAPSGNRASAPRPIDGGPGPFVVSRASLGHELLKHQALSVALVRAREAIPQECIVHVAYGQPRRVLAAGSSHQSEPAMRSVTLVMLTSMDGRMQERDDARAEIAATLIKPVPQRDLYTCLARVVSVGAHARDTGVARATVQDDLPADRRVLLVEDHPVNQAVARRMLEKLGCRVDLAENGAQAIAAYGRTHYDVILMDGQMPEMDGYEATRRIRVLEAGAVTHDDGDAAHVPIIAMTAHAMTGDRERCLAAGMDELREQAVHPRAALGRRASVAARRTRRRFLPTTA